jgi:hypothetical protein
MCNVRQEDSRYYWIQAVSCIEHVPHDGAKQLYSVNITSSLVEYQTNTPTMSISWMYLYNLKREAYQID